MFLDPKKATQALDAQIAPFAASLPKLSQRVPSFVGVPGVSWPPEVVKRAVVNAGWHMEKLDLAKVDLREELQQGRYLLDGVLNDKFVQVVNGEEVTFFTDEEDKTTPANNQAGWRHSIAVRDGRILEKEFETSADWLWLGEGNRPDPLKGYLYKILIVYRLTKCVSRDPGCKGGCSRRQCAAPAETNAAPKRKRP